MSTSNRPLKKYFFGVAVMPPTDCLLDQSSRAIYDATVHFHNEMTKLGYHLPALGAEHHSSGY